jgi:hypothetical protein
VRRLPKPKIRRSNTIHGDRDLLPPMPGGLGLGLGLLREEFKLEPSSSATASQEAPSTPRSQKENVTNWGEDGTPTQDDGSPPSEVWGPVASCQQ